MTEIEQMVDAMMCDALGLQGEAREEALRLVEESRARARSAE